MMRAAETDETKGDGYVINLTQLSHSGRVGQPPHSKHNTTRRPNAGLMLAHRLRRWANIISALSGRVVFAELSVFHPPVVSSYWCRYHVVDPLITKVLFPFFKTIYIHPKLEFQQFQT